MIKKINSANDLHISILELEQKRIELEMELKQHLSDLSENLKPVNIIKNTLQDAFGSDHTKRNILGTAIGLGSALISGKLLAGKSGTLVRKSIGAAVQFGVAGVIARNAGKIKDMGAGIINKIFKRRKSKRLDLRSLHPGVKAD